MLPLPPNACDSRAAINGVKKSLSEPTGSCPEGKRWDAFLTGSAHVLESGRKIGWWIRRSRATFSLFKCFFFNITEQISSQTCRILDGSLPQDQGSGTFMKRAINSLLSIN